MFVDWRFGSSMEVAAFVYALVLSCCRERRDLARLEEALKRPRSLLSSFEVL